MDMNRNNGPQEFLADLSHEEYFEVCKTLGRMEQDSDVAHRDAIMIWDETDNRFFPRPDTTDAIILGRLQFFKQREKEQQEMKRDFEKYLESVLDGYRLDWAKYTPRQVFDELEYMSAIKRIYKHLSTNCDDANEYLVRFDDPLKVVASYAEFWEWKFTDEALRVWIEEMAVTDGPRGKFDVRAPFADLSAFDWSTVDSPDNSGMVSQAT